MTTESLADAGSPVFVLDIDGGIAVISLTNTVCGLDYAFMQREYLRVLDGVREARVSRIVFDLSSCEHLDSITIGTLISLSHTVRRTGSGDAVLCCVSDRNLEILNRLMLILPQHERAIWQHFETREDACRSLAARSRKSRPAV